MQPRRRPRSPVPERAANQRPRRVSPQPEFNLRRHYDPRRITQYTYEQVAAAPFFPKGRIPEAIDTRLHNLFFFKPDFYRNLGAEPDPKEIRWSILLIRMRAAFKKLLAAWIRRRCDRVSLATRDPITLSDFERPITLYDMAGRSRYRFEAKALMVHIKNQLHSVNFGFPMPQMPRNPMTNLEFSIGQLTSIHEQLLAACQSYWAFSAFRDCEFHMNRFMQLHETALRHAAVQMHAFSEMNSYSAEEFHDFIATYCAFHGVIMTATDHVIIQFSIQHRPDNPYLDCWRRLYVIALMHNIVSMPQPTLSDTPVVATYKKAVSLMARILGQNLRGWIAEEMQAYRAHTAAATHSIIQQIFGVDVAGAAGWDADEDEDEDEDY
jgi:hypothetical protein